MSRLLFCLTPIWLRCGNQPTNAIEKLLRDHAQAIAAFEQDPIATCLEIL
jgi:predicted nuclease of predicted toxin-antitoxin system